MSNTYKVVVTTVYTVHAESPDEAIVSAREVVRGGIFRDNVVISSQQAQMYDPSDNYGTLSMSYFRIGNEQLG